MIQKKTFWTWIPKGIGLTVWNVGYPVFLTRAEARKDTKGTEFRLVRLTAEVMK